MKVVSHNFSFLGNFPPEKYADVRLTTSEEAEGKGKVVLAHKVVMAAVSEKMQNVFDKKCEENVVKIRNMRFGILQKIVSFVYTGYVELGEGFDGDDFIDGLDMLQIKLRKIEKFPRTSKACVEKHLSEFSFLEGGMNLLGTSEKVDENENVEYSRVSDLSSIETPRNEFSCLEDDLTLSSSSNDTTRIGYVDEHSREAFQNNNNKFRSATSFVSQVTFPMGNGVSKKDLDVNNDMESSRLSNLSSVETPRVEFSSLEGDFELSNGSTDTTMEALQKNNHKVSSTCFLGHLSVPNESVDSKEAGESTKYSSVENKLKSTGVSRPLHKAPIPLRKTFVSQRRTDYRMHGDGLTSSVNTSDESQSPENEKKIRKGDNQIICDNCGVKIRFDNYARHCKNQHPAIIIEKKSTCPICSAKVFQEFLNHHIRVFHPKKSQPDCRWLEPWSDSIRSVADEYNVKRKGQKKRTQIKCDYCDVKMSFSGYVEHCKKTHPAFNTEMKVTCPTCLNKVLQDVLSQHKKVFHSDAKINSIAKSVKKEDPRKVPVKCHLCSEIVSHNNLARHFKRMHKSAAFSSQNYKKCEFCKKKVLSLNYKHHISIVHGRGKSN